MLNWLLFARILYVIDFMDLNEWNRRVSLDCQNYLLNYPLFLKRVLRNRSEILKLLCFPF